MLGVQFHRGPDGSGKWLGKVGDTQIALGNNRLAILDLSEAGNQPMVSPSGRHVLVYNGELYNYRELRAELKNMGVEFRSECDTEVVFHALRVWGEAAIPRFNGMWALAWFDQESGGLLFSRDRFGIKPLYFYLGSEGLFFASEIKAILAGTQERFAINAPVVGRYLEQSLLDAQEKTFFAGIESVPPAHNMFLDLRPHASLVPSTKPYWKFPEEESFQGSINQRIEEVRETFLDSVRLRLRSDVPVGVLLSGGIGSSSIAAAMHKILGKDADLHMISAVCDDPRFDEQPFIDRMTTFLGCATHKVPLRLQAEEAFQFLEKITYFNEEPLGSFSNVAHYLLMKKAEELGVTVILSGQGDDELLCGYRKYLGFYLQSLVQRGSVPQSLKVFSGFLMRRTVLSQFSFQEAKRYLPRAWFPREINIRGPLLQQNEFFMDLGLGVDGVVGRQISDLSRFSIPALLHFEDRISMACSREIRLPFLDYRLVDLLLPLPPTWKLRNGWTKWVFRKAIEDWLPPEITWRKDKKGFDNPQSEWLKGGFKEQIDEFLKGELLIATQGFVDPKALQRRFEAYCKQPNAKGSIWFKDIFNSIALEFWMRRFQSNLRLNTVKSLSSRLPGPG